MSANAKHRTIEFEMWYPEMGIFFIVRLRYTERNWWGVMGLKGSRNIRVVSNRA